MNFKSKKASQIILVVTSLICSRAMFFFFDDPEGPNLLIVTVMAIMIYFLSLTVYLFNTKRTKKLPLAILIQIIIATIFYFCFS